MCFQKRHWPARVALGFLLSQVEQCVLQVQVVRQILAPVRVVYGLIVPGQRRVFVRIAMWHGTPVGQNVAVEVAVPQVLFVQVVRIG